MMIPGSSKVYQEAFCWQMYS